MPFDQRRRETSIAEKSMQAVPCQQMPPEKAHGRLLLLAGRRAEESGQAAR